jgi:hypothetical protein
MPPGRGVAELVIEADHDLPSAGLRADIYDTP